MVGTLCSSSLIKTGILGMLSGRRVVQPPRADVMEGIKQKNNGGHDVTVVETGVHTYRLYCTKYLYLYSLYRIERVEF
jgi:hypothetical protein